MTYRIELYKVGCRCLPTILADDIITISEARRFVSYYIDREYPLNKVTQRMGKYPDLGTRKETTVVNFGKKAVDNEHRITIYENRQEP